MKLFSRLLVCASIALLNVYRVAGINTSPYQIKIGALFERGHDDSQKAFTEAVLHINNDPNVANKISLVPKIETINNGDSLEVSRKVCELLSQGVVAIFGPQSPDTSSYVTSICSAVVRPHIISQMPHSFTTWNSDSAKRNFTLNFAPNAYSYYKLFPEITRSLKWTSFAIIYDDYDGILRLKEFFEIARQNIIVRQLPAGDGYRDFLEKIQEQNQINIIIDCSLNKTIHLLKHAQQIGMMGEEYHYLLTNALDAEDADFEDFRYSKSTITFTRLVYLTSPELVPVMQKSFLNFNTQMALVYHSVFFFTSIITPYLNDPTRTTRLFSEVSCESDSSWSSESSTNNNPKMHQTRSLRSLNNFDYQRQLTFFDVGIMRMEKMGVNKIAEYKIFESKINGVENLGKPDKTSKTLNVLAIPSDPYIMIKESTDGNIYEGFCIDLLKEISKMHGFQYNISQIHDNAYGSIHPTTGEFTGIIGELIKQKADMGVGDITITVQRNKVVDFSYPFSDVGISALVRKPEIHDQDSLFYFMTPFSSAIWFCIVAAYLGSCVLLFLLARINPTEWQKPSPGDKKIVFLENSLGLSNSMWFMLASFMRQWSTISPKGISTRLAAVIWWTFAILIFCFYVANLVKNHLLALEELNSPIKDIHDLARQSKIKYGVVRGGSTMAFFRNSKHEVYSAMWSQMLADERNYPQEPIFVKSVKEGIERTKQGNYAFFMESPTTEIIEQKECSLMAVGPQLSHKGHGFAFPLGSPYKDIISSAILKLQENGILRKLKLKWWNHEKYRANCKEDEVLKKITRINSRHLEGAFILLFAILPLACLAAIFEVVYKWKMTSPEMKINSIWQEIQQQLTFALNCKNKTKVIPKRQPIEEERLSDTEDNLES